MRKLFLILYGFSFLSFNTFQASYFSRVAIRSKEFVKIAQDKAIALNKKVQSYNTEKITKELEDILKDSTQEVQVIESVIQDGSKEAARKSIHMNKSGLFGKAESVIVENIQINHYGSKSWAECFFEWLKTGGQKRVAAVSGLLCATGGYVIGSHSSQPVQVQPQIVLMPAQQN